MPAPCPSPRVALFGECMLELNGPAFGAMTQDFGGDTLNTAIYLARCAPGVQVRYATALGDDPLSDGLASRWAAEGIDLGLLRRLPGRLPGLYLIEVDAGGERRFHYWRDQAAARAYFDADTTPLEARPLPCDWLYLSGISLAILPPAGRLRLLALMAELRAAGGRVVFDNNHRPRLWPDAAEARAAYEAAFAHSDMVLLTLDDHQAWLGRGHGDGLPVPTEAALAHAWTLPAAEVVVKRGAEATLWRLGDGAPDQTPGAWQAVSTEAVPQVVDTTAAGDSFAAGYLARRLAGEAPAAAAAFGNRLAARIIQHRGAVVPRAAMHDLIDDAAHGAPRPA